VRKALAIGLEHNWKGRVPARDLQQALRLQPLLPERRPPVGAAARDQQGARRVLAEASTEQCGLSELADDEVLELVRIEQQLVDGRRRIRIGEVQRDAVVRPDPLHLETERVPDPSGKRHRPRCVNTTAERCQQAYTPVADLVPEALDYDDPIGGHHRRCALLLAEEGEGVRGGWLAEGMFRTQTLEGTLVLESG